MSMVSLFYGSSIFSSDKDLVNIITVPSLIITMVATLIYLRTSFVSQSVLGTSHKFSLNLTITLHTGYCILDFTDKETTSEKLNGLLKVT